MGKLIYALNVSADGFVETPAKTLDWSTVDDELHTWFNRRAATLDASIYGRGMYETMSYWLTAESEPDANDVTREFARIWNATPRIVMSSSLDHVEGRSRLARGTVTDEYRALRKEYDGDIELGGATLAASFIRAGLVDEYQLIVHPVAIGAGTPFFPTLDEPMKLELTEMERFSSGVVMLGYGAA